MHLFQSLTRGAVLLHVTPVHLEMLPSMAMYTDNVGDLLPISYLSDMT